MFMPGYEAPKQTWQDQLARAKKRDTGSKSLKETLAERRRTHQQREASKSDFQKRAALVEQAKKRGATREELKTILNGG
jgi:hypothetical protein